MAFFGTDINSAYSGGMSDMGPSKPMGGYQVASQFEEKPTRQYSGQLDPRAPSLPTQYAQPQQQASPKSQGPPAPPQAQVRYDQDMAVLQAELQRYNESQAQSQSQSQGPSAAPQYYAPEPSFFDIMWSRRRDILKLVILSMLVVFAVSLHDAINHVLKKYILENDVTEKSETMLRFAYPLVILLFIWIAKASSGGSKDSRLY